VQLPWAKRKDRELIELKDLGLKIHADNRLEERIKQIELLHLAIEGNLNLPLEEEAPEFKVVQEIHELLESADPGNKIMGLKKQLNLLDRILRTAAIPWLRAGDGTVTARILHGWEGLYSKTKGVINSVENIIRRGEEGNIIQRLVDKSELVEKLENCEAQPCNCATPATHRNRRIGLAYEPAPTWDGEAASTAIPA